MPLNPSGIRLYGYDENDPQFNYDIFHIDRWMCPSCGLIIDYKHEEGPGWPEYDTIPHYPDFLEQYDDDPPIDMCEHQAYVDEYGLTNYDLKRMCQRCGIDFDERPLIRIIISDILKFSDISKMIKNEGSKIDFKLQKIKRDKLTKLIVAFSNSEGGRIIFGMNNDGEFIGLANIDTPNGRDEFQTYIRDATGKTFPPIRDIQVDFISENGIDIAIVTVHKGRFPYEWNGKRFIRFLNSNQPDEDNS